MTMSKLFKDGHNHVGILIFIPSHECARISFMRATTCRWLLLQLRNFTLSTVQSFVVVASRWSHRLVIEYTFTTSTFMHFTHLHSCGSGTLSSAHYFLLCFAFRRNALHTFLSHSKWDVAAFQRLRAFHCGSTNKIDIIAFVTASYCKATNITRKCVKGTTFSGHARITE